MSIITLKELKNNFKTQYSSNESWKTLYKNIINDPNFLRAYLVLFEEDIESRINYQIINATKELSIRECYVSVNLKAHYPLMFESDFVTVYGKTKQLFEHLLVNNRNNDIYKMIFKEYPFYMKVRTQFFEACNKYITNYWIDKIEEVGYYQIERSDDYIKITWELHYY